MDRNNPAINRILEEAADLVGREKEAAGNVEPTEGYKGRQIERLKEFATIHNLWIDFNVLSLVYLNKGGENEVFTGNEDFVVKLNNFDYAGDDLTNFFIRIEAHNLFFSNIPYEMIGFAYNSQNEFCAVLVQPYVRAKREAIENEIQHYMESLGFIMDYPDEYHNRVHEFEQLHFAEVAQLVEHNLAKVRVAGSSPVFRSLPKGLVILRNSGAFYFSDFVLPLYEYGINLS